MQDKKSRYTQKSSFYNIIRKTWQRWEALNVPGEATYWDKYRRGRPLTNFATNRIIQTLDDANVEWWPPCSPEGEICPWFAPVAHQGFCEGKEGQHTVGGRSFLTNMRVQAKWNDCLAQTHRQKECGAWHHSRGALQLFTLVSTTASLQRHDYFPSHVRVVLS